MRTALPVIAALATLVAATTALAQPLTYGDFERQVARAERRMERQLIEDYVQLLDQIVAQLSPANHAAAVALASVPDEIRGYGHVKEKSLAAARELQATRLQAFLAPQQDRQVACQGDGRVQGILCDNDCRHRRGVPLPRGRDAAVRHGAPRQAWHSGGLPGGWLRRVQGPARGR